MIFKQDLCNAPILLEEALDSFDESPEIQQEAINFLVGDALVDDNKEEKQRQQKAATGVPSTANPFSVMSNVIKASSEPPPDLQKRVVLANNRPVVVVVKQPEEETVAHLARSANLIAMSHSHVKSEEDVAILVEEEM